MLCEFSSDHYQLHNRARLTHLESLGLPLDGRTVLDVGSGPGDHTEFYLQRQCTVVAIDARPECLRLLSTRFPHVRVACVDMDSPGDLVRLGEFEVVHCYGLLYHLRRPTEAIRAMAAVCRRLMVLETCVSFGSELAVNSLRENKKSPTQAASGWGCRPTRPWVFAELKKHFEFVYLTRTQPNHSEFPTDWTQPMAAGELVRSVFVASRHPMDLPSLSAELLDRQSAVDQASGRF